MKVKPFPMPGRFVRILLPLLLSFALLPGWSQEVHPVGTLDELQNALSNHIHQAKFAAGTWGVQVVSLESGKTLFEHNPQVLFSPASNSKLYTMALALDRLGPDYRIKTSLYAKAQPNQRGTLNSDLVIYGRGDPTINSRLHDGDIFKALEPLVAALTNAGVRRIKGDVIGDDSFFQGPEFGSGWSWDDMQYYYGAELSALTINDNMLQVAVKPGAKAGAPCELKLVSECGYLVLCNRTETVEKGEQRSIRFYRPLGRNVVYVSGKIPLDDAGYTEDLTVHNPAGLFAALLKETLARHGVKVSGRARSQRWLDRQVAPFDCEAMVELGAVESLPMSDMVREVQKPSQNLYTDLLLAHVGEVSRRAEARAGQTSEDLGIAELDEFLAEVGIPKGDVLFEEGSGLSRNNLTTPRATIALLRHMDAHSAGEAYRAALPIAGVDGTLRRRMKGTPAEGNVRAKTGTLRWANSLSGYVTTAVGERLAFSIMLNRYYNRDASISTRSEIDTIAVMLAGFKARSVVAAK